MEWIFIIGLLIFVVSKLSKSNSVAETSSERALDQQAKRMTKELLSTATIELNTPKGQTTKRKSKKDHVFEKLTADNHITVNGKPAKSQAQDCDACGTSFVLLWSGGPNYAAMEQTHCPFCGVLCFSDEKNQALHRLIRTLAAIRDHREQASTV